MIVREVAAAHGGEVDVTSREGHGTTFTIRLHPAPAGGVAGATGAAESRPRDLALPAPSSQ